MSIAPVRLVLEQHLEEVGHLRNVRSRLCCSPNVELFRLARTDERIAAHLDGLGLAGSAGRAMCRQALMPPSRGTVFAATVLALESHDDQELASLTALAEFSPEGRAGFMSAFGWVSAELLRGLVLEWMTETSAFRQTVALAACGFHGADLHTRLQTQVFDSHAQVASRAVRLMASLGRIEMLGQVLLRVDSKSNENDELRDWAAICGVLLGDRSIALSASKDGAVVPSAQGARSFGISILAMPIDPTYAWLREWASLAQTDPIARRRLIRGCGLSGDVRYVPWLIEQMNDIKVTRIAGEAFTFITGANLALLDLERKPPENIPGGPNDDPEDDNVALDEDENLPWPDVARVHGWWTSHAASFPAGHRYLLGAPASEAQCLKVLNVGGQRQRAVAAVTRCLLKPGTPLFQVAAPAWRQKRWLAELGASSR